MTIDTFTEVNEFFLGLQEQGTKLTLKTDNNKNANHNIKRIIKIEQTNENNSTYNYK